MGRIRTIDAFRGIIIILMLVLGIGSALSGDMPEILRHNVRGALHFGDFILPMFVFASGASLVFFVKKRAAKSRTDFALDIVERFGKLAIIGVMLSPFIGEGFLGMNVILLSSILFLLAVPLVRLPQGRAFGVMLGVFVAYFIIRQLGIGQVSAANYLGGYTGAIFYLPVMLAGVQVGREFEEKGRMSEKTMLLAMAAAAVFIITALLIPIDKQQVTPPFIALSILLSILSFSALDAIISMGIYTGHMEWFGRNPLRYWTMMFVVFIIPLKYYGYSIGEYPLSIDWPAGIAMSLCGIVALAACSFCIDKAKQKLGM